MGRLTDKVAIVTGGAQGQGEAIVRAFVAEGARVVIADVNADLGKEVAGTLGDAAAFHETDVSDPDQVQALVDFAVAQFGGLHVMFNNAGIGSSFARLLDYDFADYDRVMSVNLLGVMLGTQRAARHMSARVLDPACSAVSPSSRSRRGSDRASYAAYMLAQHVSPPIVGSCTAHSIDPSAGCSMK